MTILITGSRGKTSSQLAKLLSPTHSILVATRNPSQDSPHPTVQFDWTNPSTFSNPFEHPIAKDSPIEGVYLVGVDQHNASDLVIPFVHLARERGVRRIVLLSAWEIPPGGPLMGRVHEELQKGDGEWAVVRPHFFMENFIEYYHLETIKNESKIYTAAGDGKKPFISALDIANVAKHALLAEKNHDSDFILTGSEALSYDDVAKIISNVLGRKIEHVRLSRNDFATFLEKQAGFPEDFATYMADLDVKIAGGHGAETTDAVEKVTGQKAKSFEEFAREYKDVWA